MTLPDGVPGRSSSVGIAPRPASANITATRANASSTPTPPTSGRSPTPTSSNAGAVVRLLSDLNQSPPVHSSEAQKATTARRSRGVSARRLAAHQAPAVKDFGRLADRAVSSLCSDVADTSYEEATRMLNEVRKQYDTTHREADQRERELLQVRREIHLIEAENQPRDDSWNGITRESVLARLEQVAKEIDESLEQKRVHEHMVARLTKELHIVQRKVKIMEDHLKRKTTEAARQQNVSRRVHQDKIACVNKFEAMEQEMEVEREICNNALDDLEYTTKMRQDGALYQKDFENWRYEIAMEAANEAFQATAGRYWKIYAVEKLTGNCLQKITFEQLEQSQMIEDGFQKIREVTGLTHVMEIVHKFMNREAEHEQLQVSRREAEARLHSLREAEASRQAEGTSIELLGDQTRPRGLHMEVSRHEQQLNKAVRDHEDLQRRLRKGDLLFHGIRHWTERMNESFAAFEELEKVQSLRDLVPYFNALVQTVNRFLSHARSEMSSTKLSKMASAANGRDYTEQQKLLTDKDFIRANCRVPAALDMARQEEPRRRVAEQDDRQDLEFIEERKKQKKEAEARRQPGEKDALARSQGGSRPGSRRGLGDTGASDATASFGASMSGPLSGSRRTTRIAV